MGREVIVHRRTLLVAALASLVVTSGAAALGSSIGSTQGRRSRWQSPHLAREHRCGGSV